MVSRRVAAVFVAAGLAAAAGCGDGGPALHPAGGTVAFADGEPVPGAIVEFLPAGGGPAARGRTDVDGRFTLATAGEPGAVAGAHRVGVTQAVLMDGFGSHVRHMANKRVVAPQFNSPASSGLSAEVPAGGSGDLTIVVPDE